MAFPTQSMRAAMSLTWSGGTTLIGDADPIGDSCSTTTGAQVSMSGQNIGDLLNSRGVTWGWFQGGFDLTVKNANGTTGCAARRCPRSRR